MLLSPCTPRRRLPCIVLLLTLLVPLQAAESFGNLVYLRDLAGSGLERPSGIVLDSNAIYFVGAPLPQMSAVGGDAPPILLRKIDKSGNPVWSQTLGPSRLYFKPFGVAVHDSAVYVAGSRTPANPAGPPDDADVLVSKFDVDGTLQWERRFGTSSPDAAFAVAADSSGVYVVGDAGPLLPSTQINALFVRKYDPNGNALWTRQDVGWGTGITGGIALDNTGVYTAYVHSDGAVLHKYDKNGIELWRRPSGGLGELETGVATDGRGVVYVAKGGLLTAFSSDGVFLWESRFSDRGSAVFADGSAVYVAGSVQRSIAGQCEIGGGDAVVRRFDSNGAVVWTRQYGTRSWDITTGIAADAEGVYIAGWRGSQTDRGVPINTATLARFDKDAAVLGSGPRIQWDCVLNAASFAGGAVSPGELITLKGVGFAAGTQQVTPGLGYPREAAGVKVMIDDIAAPLMHVSPTQINAIVPYGIADRAAVSILVENNGVRSEAVTVPVIPMHVGLFTADGSGAGALFATNEDGINSPSSPAARGSVVILYGTGAGGTNPPSDDGVRYIDGAPSLTVPVELSFERAQPLDGADAVAAEVLYIGGIPGVVAGLFQIVVRVPQEAATGPAVPVYVSVGRAGAQPGITLSIR